MVLFAGRLGWERTGLRLADVSRCFLADTNFGSGLLIGPFMLDIRIAGEELMARLLKTAVFGMTRLLTGELALTCVLIGVFIFLGHRIGRWIVRLTQIRFRIVILEAY